MLVLNCNTVIICKKPACIRVRNMSMRKLTHHPHLCPVIVIQLMFGTCERQRREGKKKRRKKSKAKAKQTAGMRSRRKPVKPGDRGQTSQIHITKRSYKSSRGGVSVDPEKINPSVTIQGHRHGTHGGQSRSNNKATRTKSTSIIQGGDTAHHNGRNTMCLCGPTHTHTQTLIGFTPFPSHIG